MLLFIFIFLRIVSAILILVNPVLFSIISFLLDAFDHPIFVLTKVRSKYLTLEKYEMYDKILDTFYSLFMFLTLGRFIEVNGYLYYVLLAFFVWRVIGVVLFIFKNERRLLIFFPSLFEYMYFLILLFYYQAPTILGRKDAMVGVIVVLFIIKIVQEYLCHIKRYYPFSSLYNRFGREY